MRQDRDEPVCTCAVRLRGHASICGFQVECKCKVLVDYDDIMVRYALVRGLEDEEIRLDVLGHHTQDLTLSEVLQIADAKEEGKRSAGHFNASNLSSSADATSSYQRLNRNAQHESWDPRTNAPCSHCGQLGHGRSP